MFTCELRLEQFPLDAAVADHRPDRFSIKLFTDSGVPAQDEVERPGPPRSVTVLAPSGSG